MDTSSKWQGVCDQDFSMNEANVVCRTMGYTAGAKEHYTDSHFGSNNYGFALAMVKCTGDEESLEECILVEANACGTGTWASVECNEN